MLALLAKGWWDSKMSWSESYPTDFLTVHYLKCCWIPLAAEDKLFGLIFPLFLFVARNCLSVVKFLTEWSPLLSRVFICE